MIRGEEISLGISAGVTDLSKQISVPLGICLFVTYIRFKNAENFRGEIRVFEKVFDGHDWKEKTKLKTYLLPHEIEEFPKETILGKNIAIFIVDPKHLFIESSVYTYVHIVPFYW